MHVPFPFIVAKDEELKILVLLSLTLGKRSQDKGILLVAKDNFGGEERLTNKINITQYFDEVVISLEEESYVLIPVRLLVDVEQILFPLFDLLNDEGCKLSVVGDFQLKFGH